MNIGSPAIPRNLCSSLSEIKHRVAGVFVLLEWLRAESVCVSWPWDRAALARVANCSLSTASRAKRWLIEQGWIADGGRGEVWPSKSRIGETDRQYYKLPRGVLRSILALRSTSAWRIVWWLLPRMRACYWHGRSRFRVSCRWLASELGIDRDAVSDGLAELHAAGIVSAVSSSRQGTTLAAFCRLTASVASASCQEPDAECQKPATPRVLNSPDHDSKTEFTLVEPEVEAVGQLLLERVGLGWTRTTAAISAWLGSAEAAERWLENERPKLQQSNNPAGWLVYCWRQGWSWERPSEAAARILALESSTPADVLRVTRVGAHVEGEKKLREPDLEALRAAERADLADRIAEQNCVRGVTDSAHCELPTAEVSTCARTAREQAERTIASERAARRKLCQDRMRDLRRALG